MIYIVNAGTFAWGIGRLSNEATCRLGLELEAISDLDYLYNKINDWKANNEEIIDFQPTEAEIDQILSTKPMKSAGVVWFP